MRVKELSKKSGVSIATIKFYLREGLLKPGEATGPNQASYDESHVHRLRVIRALIAVAGLSVQQSLAIFNIIDGTGDDVLESIGEAVAFLPHGRGENPADGEHPEAQRAMRQVEEAISPTPNEALESLGAALCAAEDAGLHLNPKLIESYLTATGILAKAELESLNLNDSSRTVEHAVLGTVLLEAVIIALRRVQQEVVFSSRYRETHPSA